MIPLAIICTSIVLGNITYLIITDNQKQHEMERIITLDEQVDKFIEKIANVRGYTMDDMKSKNRKSELAIVRQMICYLTRRHFYHTNISYSNIGKRINRDHSTVYYSINEVEKMLEMNDKRMTALFNEVMEAFNLGKAA